MQQCFHIMWVMSLLFFDCCILSLLLFGIFICFWVQRLHWAWWCDWIFGKDLRMYPGTYWSILCRVQLCFSIVKWMGKLVIDEGIVSSFYLSDEYLFMKCIQVSVLLLVVVFMPKPPFLWVKREFIVVLLCILVSKALPLHYQ